MKEDNDNLDAQFPMTTGKLKLLYALIIVITNDEVETLNDFLNY